MEGININMGPVDRDVKGNQRKDSAKKEKKKIKKKDDTKTFDKNFFFFLSKVLHSPDVK